MKTDNTPTASPVYQQNKDNDNSLSIKGFTPDSSFLLDEIRAEREELEKQSMDNIGMFRIRTANETIREASLRPNPEPLWLSLWYEGEVCCLFADSNLGKSIYAVQIATEIAFRERVLYFDFELSDKQFQLRYTSDKGDLYRFPENLYRCEISQDNLNVGNFEDNLINEIEATAIRTGSKILIIDNLTYLCIATEKGDLAGTLMMRLVTLKKKYDLSILVLAHTPKRPLTNPITQNDLAGSKKLYNFFDSVFAIGKSCKDTNIRYVKQIKCRYGNFEYDSDNVIICSIEKNGSFLSFVQIGFSEEREHLREPSENDRADLLTNVRELSGEGKSYRQIADSLNLSLGKVQRIMKRIGVSGVSGVSG